MYVQHGPENFNVKIQIGRQAHSVAYSCVFHALKLEGLAREIISKVQSARKDAGLEVEDRIQLSLRTESADLTKAIAAHGDLIAGEVLATALVALDAEHTGVKAGGEALGIALQRA